MFDSVVKIIFYVFVVFYWILVWGLWNFVDKRDGICLFCYYVGIILFDFCTKYWFIDRKLLGCLDIILLGIEILVRLYWKKYLVEEKSEVFFRFICLMWNIR